MFIGSLKRRANDDIWEEYITEQYREYYRELYDEVMEEMEMAHQFNMVKPSDIQTWSHSINYADIFVDVRPTT